MTDNRPVVSKMSIRDGLGLTCAGVMLIAFFLLLWYNTFGGNYVGPGPFAQFEGIGMYLIPIAGIAAGPIALHNLWLNRHHECAIRRGFSCRG